MNVLNNLLINLTLKKITFDDAGKLPSDELTETITFSNGGGGEEKKKAPWQILGAMKIEINSETAIRHSYKISNLFIVNNLLDLATEFSLLNA